MPIWLIGFNCFFDEKFNEQELINVFNKYGIYLVIEDALNGTKIRGCSMVKGNNPTIYITRYFNQLLYQLV